MISREFRFTAISLVAAASTAAAQDVRRPADIPAETFAKLPLVDSVTLSPDGESIAFFSSIDGQRTLILDSVDGSSRPHAVPAYAGFDFRWVRWANDERVVFLISTMGRRGITETEESRLWAINRDGTNSISIIKPVRETLIGSNLGSDRHPPQIQDGVVSWLPASPDEIMVAVDGDGDGAFEVRRVDINNARYTMARDDYPFIQHWLADATGDLRYGWGYRSAGRRVIQDHDSGWERASNLPWQARDFFPVAFPEDRNQVYMRGVGAEDTVVVRTYDISEDRFGDIVFENNVYDAEEMAFDFVTDAPVGVRYTEHYPKTAYFDAAADRLQRSIDAVLPDTNNEIVSWSRDRRRVLIRASSDVDAGTYALLDRDQGELTYVGDVMAGVPPELMSPTRPISFVASDGMELYGYLTSPSGSDERLPPAVIFVGDFPSVRADQSFSFLAQFLASRGYAVLSLNVRGTTGYGQRYEGARNGEWGGKVTGDVIDAIQYLARTGIADAGRICVLGWEFGSVPAVNAMARKPQEIACGVSINGVLNLPRWISDRQQYVGGWSRVERLGLARIEADRDSPYHQADSIVAPLLIVQSEDNATTVERHGRRMATRLERLGRPVEYLAIEIGGSLLTTEHARSTVLSRIEEFLDASLAVN